MLDGGARHHPGVEAGAAGHHEDLVDHAQVVVRHAHLVQVNRAAVDAADQRVAHRVGLLVDLLEHEVRIAALLGGLEVPRHFALLGLDLVAVHRRNADLARANLDDPVVVDHEEGVGPPVDRGDVRREVAGGRACPADERRAAPCADDQIRLVGVDDGNGELALDLLEAARTASAKPRPFSCMHAAIVCASTSVSVSDVSSSPRRGSASVSSR